MKSLTTIAVGFWSLVITQADIIPGSLPILTPFTPGLTEVTYHLALTTQQIKPGSEFVILDVIGFDRWETPSISYSLSVELTTSGINAYDDPLKENLRFTFMDLEALTGPMVLTPLSGFIFEESLELTTRSANFATHAFQLEDSNEEVIPTAKRVSRHAIILVPESSTAAAVVALTSLTGLVWLRRRS